MPVRLVITDAMWDWIEPLMSADPVRGRRWADHRRTLEAIAWKYRTSSPWRDLPDELGSFKTAHKRLIRWVVDGTWERILAAVLAAADADDDIERTVSRIGGVEDVADVIAFLARPSRAPSLVRRRRKRRVPHRLTWAPPSRERDVRPWRGEAAGRRADVAS